MEDLFDQIEEDQESDSQEELKQKNRESIIKSVSSSQLNTLEQKVAWILNYIPETRDSDIRLQLEYWERFQPDLFNGSIIYKDDYYKLQKLTSLKRARAKIQNTLDLYKASLQIRKYRGVLSEEEKENAVENERPQKVFSIYADESGKNENILIVGSVWFLDGIDTIKLNFAITDLKNSYKFKKELHFREMRSSQLPMYKAIIDLVVNEFSFISFKAVAIEQSGIRNKEEALKELYYQILLKGAEHENDSNRAPLPRLIQLFKDSESPGFDKLLLTQLKERISIYSKTHLDGKLVVDEFEALSSEEDNLIQLADLFTSSLNRIINVDSTTLNHKDEFANYFLMKVGINLSDPEIQNFGDQTVYIKL